MMDKRSEEKLQGVHPHLVAVVRRAHQMMEESSNGLSFVVTEGMRSIVRQAELVAVGASRTMDSYHLRGDAVDVMATVNGDGRWDWPLYPKIARRFKDAAEELGYSITWGGDWKRLRDGPHFQIEHGGRA